LHCYKYGAPTGLELNINIVITINMPPPNLYGGGRTQNAYGVFTSKNRLASNGGVLV